MWEHTQMHEHVCAILHGGKRWKLGVFLDCPSLVKSFTQILGHDPESPCFFTHLTIQRKGTQTQKDKYHVFLLSVGHPFMHSSIDIDIDGRSGTVWQKGRDYPVGGRGCGGDCGQSTRYSCVHMPIQPAPGYCNCTLEETICLCSKLRVSWSYWLKHHWGVCGKCRLSGYPLGWGSRWAWDTWKFGEGYFST